MVLHALYVFNHRPCLELQHRDEAVLTQPGQQAAWSARVRQHGSLTACRPKASPALGALLSLLRCIRHR